MAWLRAHTLGRNVLLLIYPPHKNGPHNSQEHDSLNELISKEEYYLSYVKLDDAIILDRGPGSWLCKTDIVDAFKQIPIHPSLWHLYGVKWDEEYFFFTRLVFYCDNEATIHIIMKGRSKIQHIMRLMRRLTWCAAKGNFIIMAKHITGVNNDIADALSRFQMSRFRQLAPRAALTSCKCPAPSEVM